MLVSSRATRLALAVAGVVVALDVVSKQIAVATLSGQGRVDVLGGLFHLELYRNFDGPGNSFAGHTFAISVATVVAVIAIAIAATRVRTRLSAIAVGLLLGGGVGNMLDRLLRAPAPLHGGVVDWLKPTLDGGSMNLADLSLNAALIVAVAAALWEWWSAAGAAGRDAGGSKPDRAGSSGASGR
jgi:signal peptidase II